MVVIGLLIVVAGLFFWLFGDKLRFLGRLPGDIGIERENVRVYIPVTTMLILSALLSLILWLLQRFR